MRSIKSTLSIFSIIIFLAAIGLSSCGSSSQVHSGSSMGNTKHKNKHVWGK